jgi:beta-lactam-binding protein with PASTA domain
VAEEDIGIGLVLLSVLSGYITMNIFLERDRIAVPVVIGLELKEAARQLREVGLQPRMAGEEYHAACGWPVRSTTLPSRKER